MIFADTDVEGAFLIQPERLEDERGFFARTYCVRELGEHGLDPQVVQRSVSYNRRRGTLRGMHYQVAPHEETKLVSCSRGEIYDVIVDLRPASPTYRRWSAATLTADNGHLLYIPQGLRARLHHADRRRRRRLPDLRFSSPRVGARRPLRRSGVRREVAVRAQRHQRARSCLARLPRMIVRGSLPGSSHLDRPMSYSERLLERGSFLTRLAHNGRYRRALDLVGDLRGAIAIDFGCGDAMILRRAYDRGIVRGGYGVDNDPAMRESAAATFAGIDGFRFLHPDELTQVVAPGSCDLAICTEALEHIPQPAAILDAICRYCRPGGHALITVPIEVGPSLIGKQMGRYLADLRRPYGYEIVSLARAVLRSGALERAWVRLQSYRRGRHRHGPQGFRLPGDRTGADGRAWRSSASCSRRFRRSAP